MEPREFRRNKKNQKNVTRKTGGTTSGTNAKESKFLGIWAAQPFIRRMPLHPYLKLIICSWKHKKKPSEFTGIFYEKIRYYRIPVLKNGKINAFSLQSWKSEIGHVLDLGLVVVWNSFQRKTKIQNLDFRLLDEIHVWNELQTTTSPKSETCPISLFRDCTKFAKDPSK